MKINNNKNSPRSYEFKALTDLWTGSVTFKKENNGRVKEKIVSDRLITTGLFGSIRWWFEVLVRGLGGSACDPTGTKCEGQNHCVVCELFGCTGWARKFRFEVLDENGNMRKRQEGECEKISPQIVKDEEFTLRFTPLRPIRIEEWTLLDATLRLIAEYGAIGGKTVFKPTDEPRRANKLHHKDFGLVKMIKPAQFDRKGRNDLEIYLSKWLRLNHGEFAWASLQHFWCVKGKYLARQGNDKSTFNQVLGRKHAKEQGQRLANHSDNISKWLAGSQRESKKVFSFKKPARTFGFAKPGLVDFDAMKKRLQDVWGEDGWEFLTGEKIIDRLLAKEGDRS